MGFRFGMNNLKPWGGISGQDEQAMIDQLLKNLSTVAEQQQNRVSDESAYLPESVLESRRRGVRYGTAMAAEKGSFDVSKYASEANRQAQIYQSNAQLQRELTEMNQPGSGEIILNYLSRLGGSLGYAYGAGMFGGN